MNPEHSGKIFKTIWELKKKGRAEATLRGISKRLKTLAREVNLDDPDSVRFCIANKQTSNSYKECLVVAYDHYVKANGLKWEKPVYRREENAIRVPTTENVEKLIAYAGPKYSTIISIMKDTGARPCELERVRLKDLDFEQRIIYLPSRKGSRGRAKKLKTSTVAMLKRYVARGKYGIEDPVFPTSKAMTHGFMRQRNRLAEKLHDPTIKTIRFYDLRHYFATMTYMRTKDIVYTQNEMGHKRITNTLKYIHLVNFKDDEWISKVAKTVNEACQLVEAGFEYVCDVEDVKLFRKRK